jgi:meiotically up-regulated gene 157 (Mug157) protein
MQLDPYANAFRADYTVWERKYELDSLLYPIILAWTYWKATGDASIFTADYQQGLLSALATMELEQHHQAKSKFTHETLGKNPVAETGMIWTAFRPSDDPSKYNYLIPSEMMAVVALGELAEIEKDVYKDATAASKAEAMKLAVHNGIQHYAIVHTSRFGDVYAFEVDGLGNSLLMDDANIPSLLGAPYMGYLSANDPIYQNTRRMLLSPDDPNFHTGTVASGIGSEHTPAGTIWPLSMLMQAFTATTDNERDECVRQLLASDPGDHTLHESFYPDDPKRYTRPDFGWPNALFAEYVMLHTLHMPPLPVPPQSDLPAREALQKPNQK